MAKPLHATLPYPIRHKSSITPLRTQLIIGQVLIPLLTSRHTQDHADAVVMEAIKPLEVSPQWAPALRAIQKNRHHTSIIQKPLSGNRKITVKEHLSKRAKRTGRQRQSPSDVIRATTVRCHHRSQINERRHSLHNSITKGYVSQVIR